MIFYVPPLSTYSFPQTIRTLRSGSCIFIIPAYPHFRCTQLSILILALVFLLIAIRQVGGITLRIWQIMVGGAVAVLLLGEISIPDAVRAINSDVMLFLFGMFVVGEALEESGYLRHLTDRTVDRTRTGDRILLLLILSFGVLSAFLMNDTLAIIGAPLVIHVARKRGISARPLLLALCFSVTTGSVLSPIGNPQNLLIATYSPLDRPFVLFLLYLGLPTLLSLGAVFAVLRWIYRSELEGSGPDGEPEVIRDPALTRIVQLGLLVIGALILLKATGRSLPLIGPVYLPYIALGGALPVLLFSRHRIRILRRVDWATLVFFVALFVLMASVWETGLIQSLARQSGIRSVPALLVWSIGISQLISNVPFVALFQPLLISPQTPVSLVMALAAGSTLAGNLTILGAASNVIIIQNAERRGETLRFWEFLRAGLPVTLIQAGIFAVFLSFSPG